jgi:Family of unknown function (DUF7019)
VNKDIADRFVMEKDVRTMHPPLKHYLYVSDAKVDMYFADIPPGLLEGLAVELALDLKVLGAGVSAMLKPGQIQDSRISRLKVVLKYMEKHMSSKIGQIDAPLEYFRGTLPMFWGKLPTQNNIRTVFFTGSTEQTLLTLGGSAYHVIGKKGDATIGESSSDLPTLIDILAEELQLQPRSLDREDFYDEDAALNAIEVMTRRVKGIPQCLEFLAKKLAYDPSSLTHGRTHRREKHVLFGTPIYVALAE